MYRLYTISLLLLLGFTISCTNSTTDNGGNEASKTKKLTVLTTTGMIGDVVENIVKDKGEVTSLMGPGVDPHYYKATQGDLKKLTDSDIVFYNGLFLEGKMESILEKMAKKKPVYAITRDLKESELIDANEEGSEKFVADPHIWFDVPLWAKTVDVIVDGLSKLDADNKSFYEKNGKEYKAELKKTYSSVNEQLKSIPEGSRVLITSHDAFSYFGRAHNMEVMALQGISTIAEFGLKDISDLVNEIVKRKIKAVFVESSVSSKPIEAVLEGCKQKGHDVKNGGELFSDAMGAKGAKGGTYIGMIKSNAETIVNALK